MKLKLKFRRVVSFILTLCMVASMLSHFGPVFAQAADLTGYTDATSLLKLTSTDHPKILVEGLEYRFSVNNYNYNLQYFESELLNPENEFQVYLTFEFGQEQRETLNFYYEFSDYLVVGDIATTIIYESNVKVGTFRVTDNTLFINWDVPDDNRTFSSTFNAKWADGATEEGNIKVYWDESREATSKYSYSPVAFNYADFDVVKNSVYETEDGDIVSVSGSEYDSVAGLKTLSSQGNNSLYKLYEIELSLKDGEEKLSGTIDNITLRDKISSGSTYLKPASGMFNGYDVKIVGMSKTGIAVSTTYADFKWFDDELIGQNEFYIDGISFNAEWKSVKIYYYAIVDEADRPTMDAKCGSNGYGYIDLDNVAVISYEKGGNTLTAGDMISERYHGGTAWIDKVDSGDVADDLITYNLLINKNRDYTLGGSMVVDSFVSGSDVFYQLVSDSGTNVFHYMTYRGTGEVTNWATSSGYNYYVKALTVSYSTYVDMLALGSADATMPAMDALLADSELLAAIYADTGYSVTASNISDRVFVVDITDPEFIAANERGEIDPGFIFFLRKDVEGQISAHKLTYYIDKNDNEFLSVTNTARVWYKNNMSRDSEYWGSAEGFMDKKNASASTDSVPYAYVGSDGNYYVDWDITINIAPGSDKFEQVWFRDHLPSYTYNTGTEDIVLRDWIAGLEEDDISANLNTEKYNEIFDKAFEVYSDSTDPEVQKVVENIVGGFTWGNQAPLASYVDTSINENFDIGALSTTNYQYSDMVLGGTIYSGDWLEAGQFIAQKVISYDDKVWANIGDTWTPGMLLFYVGDLPATEEGYTIHIKYTTQVNPVLVDLVEAGLIDSNIPADAKYWFESFKSTDELLEMDNDIVAQQAYHDTDKGSFVLSPYTGESDGVLGTSEDEYYLDLENTDPPIVKTGEYSNNGGNPTFDYIVKINENDVIEAKSTDYRIQDTLSISGFDYIADSVVIKDSNGLVVYSSDSSQISSIYKDLVSCNVTGQTVDGASTLDFHINNRTGAFTTSSGYFKELIIEYSVSVESNLLDEGECLDNTVQISWFDVMTWRKIGSAKCSVSIDSVITKELKEKPSADNDYTAEFLVAVHMDSPYVTEELVRQIENTGVVTIIDDPQLGLENIMMSSVQIVIADNGKEVSPDNYEILDCSFNEELEGKLVVRIKTDEVYDQYNVIYKAKLDGDLGETVDVLNIASVEDSNYSFSYSKSFYLLKPTTVASVNSTIVNVYKHDSENAILPIAGVEFDLYKYSNLTWNKVELSQPLVSDSDGLIKIDNSLSSGDTAILEANTWYCLVETKTGDNYALDETPHYFMVKGTGNYTTSLRGIDGNTVSYSIENEQGHVVQVGREIELSVSNEYLTLNIIKTDKLDGTRLNNAQFTLYEDINCTKEVAVSTLDADDKSVCIISDIPTGETGTTTAYYLKETKAPVDYTLDSTVYKVLIENNKVTKVVSLDGSKTLTVDTEGSVVTITSFPNSTISGNLKITKTLDTNNTLTVAHKFEFTVKLTNASGAALQGNYPYTIYNAVGNAIETGTVTNGGTISFNRYCTAIIEGLPENTRYTITETEIEGYDTSYQINDYEGNIITSTRESNIASGKITSGCLDTVSFTNKAVAHVELEVYKELDTGSLYDVDDTFEFTVTKDGVLLGTVKANKSTGKLNLSGLDMDIDTRGTFTYEFKEVIPTTPSDYIEYDTRTITAEVDAWYVGTTGAMRYSVTYSGGEGDNSNTFINKYSADGPYEDPENPSEDDLGLVFTANKTVNGSSTHDMMPAGKFTFGIYEGNTLIAEGTNDASGKITFDKIVYYLNGTTDDTGYHYYTVRETGTAGNGWTYDNHEYAVTVRVTNNGDGTLSANVVSGARKSGDTYILTSTDGDVTFENTYEFENANVHIYATKGLYGTELSSGQFSFGVYENGKLVGEATNDADGSINIYLYFYRTVDSNGVEQTNIGKHTYVLKEIIPDTIPAGYKYDTTERTFTLNVVDNGDGTIKVDSYSGISAIYAPANVYGYVGATETFNNFYNASGALFLEASKEIDGRDLVAGEFEFTATEYKVVDGVKTTTGNVYTATNDADGNIVFDGIEYIRGYETISTPYVHYKTIDETGTYYYEIAEVDNGAGGVEFDSTVYEVTVLVADNGDGTLSVTPSANATKLSFTNGYEAKGEVTFTATKNINGSAQNDQMTTGKFAFVIYEGDSTVASGTNDGNGNITFSTINYTTDDIGIHVYTVVEADAGVNGWEYDTQKYTVTVTVADNGDGTLSITVNGATKSGENYSIDPTSGKNATFENTYEVSEQVLINANVILEGSKLKDGQFTFGIYDEDDNLVCFAKNDANGNIVFDKFEFYRSVDANGNEVQNLGTNTYEIKQIIPDPKAGGYTYDEDVYTVTITATDDGKGKISVVVENDSLIYTKSTDSYAIKYDSAKKATWVNSYEATGPLDFSDLEGLDGIVKNMTGRNPLDGEFEFVVYEYKMVGTSYVATGKVFKTTNDANGNIDFDDITYVLNETRDDTGNYMYVFKEIIPMDADKNPAVTYDTTEYKLEVAVSDNGDGTLNVVSISNFSSITFTNNYEAYGSAELSATVSINGNKNHIYMIPGTFTFEIYENGEVVATATNDANGNIDFSTIEFVADANGSDVGTHTYTIKQVACNIPGYECDDTVYTVVIEVVDDYVGNLTAEIVSGATLDGDVIAVTPATGKTENFENVYTVSETLTIETFKELLGRVLEDEQFEFGIYEDGELIATGKNDVNGNVVFEDIEFFRDYDAANGETTYLGTHYYQIKEIIPDPKVGGYVYSEDVINVTVTAVDDGKGDITFTVTNTTAATAENTYETNDKFTNEYWADGFIEFEGLKELLGRTMDDGEFKFLVTEYKIVDGERVATGNVYEGTNDVNGIITFDEIIYNMNPNVNDCGEYVYVVTEFIPDEDNKRGGVTYDEETSYEVTVVVTDNGNGTLKASPSDNFQSLNFTNIYNAIGTLDISVTIKAESAGEPYHDVNDFGANMGNTFEVDLYEIIPGAGPDGEDAEIFVGTIEVPVDGTVSFEEIEYFINGNDNNIGDHRYKIVQKSTQDAPGYENGIDDTEYYINVSVTDNRDGTLNVVITNDGGEEVGESGTNATYGTEFTNIYDVVPEPWPPTPSITDPEPSITDPEPSITDPEPSITDPEPSITDPEPSITDPEPSITDPEPSITDPEPSITDPEPSITDPDITVTDAPLFEKVIENAEKAVISIVPGDGAFTFTVYEGDETLSSATPIEELTVVSTGESKADGSIEFTPIYFTMADRGMHYYVIYENEQTIDGVINSDEPVFMTIQALNNGDGTMTLITKYYKETTTEDESGNTITTWEEVSRVVINNKATETKFDVVNEAGENIADADIEIRDLDGNVITTYTSTEETQTIHGLKVNTVYVMHETDAPFGYVLGEDIYFMLDEDGNLLILDGPEDTEGTPADAVVMTNKLTETKINIIDPEGTNLPGAELEILDEEGNVVGTLTSSDQTDIYEGLDVNTKYTLHEVKAPDGYVLGEDITFWIDENGNLYIVDEEGNDVPVESLDMVNEKTEVKINVTDPEGTHLPGAELEIIDKDGNVVGKITTEGETVIYEGLITGEDYILRETKAPDGYLPDDDIHFWIDENGNLFIVDEDGNDVPAESLDLTNEKTKVDISVEDPDGNNIPGGKFEIIDPEGNVVDEFISSGDIDTIIGLITGKDYILHQVEAPDGYEPSEDIHFWIDEDGGLHILDKDGNEFMDDKIVVVNKPVVEPGSPATGDDSNIAPMAIIALMAMAMFVIVLKKKEEENCYVPTT